MSSSNTDKSQIQLLWIDNFVVFFDSFAVAVVFVFTKLYKLVVQGFHSDKSKSFVLAKNNIVSAKNNIVSAKWVVSNCFLIYIEIEKTRYGWKITVKWGGEGELVIWKMSGQIKIVFKED